MAITVLSTVIVPESIIEAGVRGKQIRRNDRVRGNDGEMTISIGWSNTLRQYELGTMPLTITQWQTIEGLHEVTEGGAYGMLMQDPKDFTASDTTGLVTLISAPAHTYQLIKRYTSIGSSLTKDRTIRRPQAASFILKISGTPTGSYTLDVTTGVVTIPADPDPALVTWSGQFYVPVHFQSDAIDWELSRSGDEDERLLIGPLVILDEVRE